MPSLQRGMIVDNHRQHLKAEILRYLGYRNQGLDGQINSLIDHCIEEICQLKRAKYTYRFHELTREGRELGLKGANLYLPGEDIQKQLCHSSVCLLMAVTLGHEVDRKIRYYEKIDLTRALILDACATAVIETVCDELCGKLAIKLAQEQKKLTSRFSPGYGDLPLNIQGPLLDVLGAGKAIGLTASCTNVLIPRKSVTAIAGIVALEQKIIPVTCQDCSQYSTCHFNKGGKGCGV